LRPAADAKQCAWLLVDATTGRPATEKVDLTPWTLRLSVRRRADNGEAIRLYQRN
jgi:hypothetical protein